MALSRLQILSQEQEESDSPAAPPVPAPSSSAVVDLVVLALRLLGTRTIMLGNALLPVVGLSMGFALWWRCLPDPSPFQLTGLGLFGAFFLLLVLVRR
jgi:hypothetical protein